MRHKPSSNLSLLNRRDFIGRSAALLGTAVMAPAGLAAAGKRSHADQVELGKTGLRCSRLGIGTGSHSGNVQRALGKEGFIRLIHYAFDQGITYIDCAQSYATFEWIGDAIKGLPREKLFVQSKIGGQPEKVLEVIDRHRKVFDTDYVDSLLVHCMVQGRWTDGWKRIMDGFDEARERKWIRAKGVSCHSLPALSAAVASDWTQIHLVRLNPQGAHVDTPAETWNAKSDPSHVPPVVEQIKLMRAKGRGVLGMKLVGDGDFTNAEDREKAMQYAMKSGLLDSVVVGFKSTAEIDETIERMNRALAA
ncbi:MAG: aldo/keto reductase [Verrucomicrobia bacterium]|nr:aldo/keto reductase [Verrucomicrobiota bacterium]